MRGGGEAKEREHGCRRKRRRIGAPALKLRTLVCIDPGQPADGACRIDDRAAQQDPPSLHQSFDRGDVEEVGRIGDADAEQRALVEDIEAEIEMGAAFARSDRLQP